MIYFIECGDFVKIGYTGDRGLRKRLSVIRSGNPYPIRVLFTAPGNVADEQMLHRRFGEFHHRGEWFHKKPELMTGMKGALFELQNRKNEIAIERIHELTGASLAI